MSDLTPLTSLQRTVYYNLRWPYAVGAAAGHLLRWPCALLAVSGTTFAATLETWTFGFIIAVPMSLALLLCLTVWIPELIFVADRDPRNGKKRLLTPPDRHERSICWAAGIGIVLGCVLHIRRMPHELMLGANWVPLTLISAGLAVLALEFGPSVFGYEKERVSADQYFARLGIEELQAQTSAPSGLPDQRPKDVVHAVAPRFQFEDLHGMADLKRRLLAASKPVVAPRRTGDAEPRNGVIFFGDPGNGKTFVAEALAGELGVPLITVDYSKVVSQFVGATPQNIARAFEQARSSAPCVLFVDEIDSFIVDRDSPTRNTSEGAEIVNLFLTELVNIRRHQVLVVAATNRLDKLDAAAVREGRFDFKLEVPAPDAEARVGLLLDSLNRHLANTPVQQLDIAAVHSAAHRWNGFSVKRILAVGEEMPAYLREHPSEIVGFPQLMGALRRVQGRKGAVPADTKRLIDLILPESTRTAIQLIADRMADPLRIERLGGTLPGGVLFYGPSGTGKTAAARALAKETGWAFLSVAGPDLLRDADKIERLYAHARELRPAIVFIDEADDILRNRQHSQTSALTNKLLTILDGAGEKTKDIVLIAATNNPDDIDSAMLRAGRFTEKVPFFAADATASLALVENWLKARRVLLAEGTSLRSLARLLQGLSPANIEGTLQHALNMAIGASSSDHVVLSLDLVAAAVEVVMPEGR